MKLKSVFYSLGPALFRRPDLNHPPTAVGGIAGFSHNLFRWWDSRTRFVLACRLDLNNPPTPVGGISEFSFFLRADWGEQ